MKKITTLLIVIILSALSGCGGESTFAELSASGQIIAVEKHDVIGDDIKTTIVFDNGQVESLWEVVGDKGDVVFVDPVVVRVADSSIVRIPSTAVVKNITKGRKFYGQ